jgi:hypothetical protein
MTILPLQSRKQEPPRERERARTLRRKRLLVGNRTKMLTKKPAMSRMKGTKRARLNLLEGTAMSTVQLRRRFRNMQSFGACLSRNTRVFASRQMKTCLE